jgi:hypothetical protein
MNPEDRGLICVMYADCANAAGHAASIKAPTNPARSDMLLFMVKCK